MPTYYDLPDGTRVTGELRYFDTPVGVRVSLSGEGVVTSGGGDTPVDPNPGGGFPQLPLMFIWPGGGNSTASMTSTLGQAPQGWCQYVQRPDLDRMVANLSPLARAGYHLQVGCGAPNDKPPTYPSGSLELMKGLADGTTFAVNWWTEYLVNMDTISQINPNITIRIAPIVEPETGYMQGSHNSTSAALGEPTSGTPTQRAQTLATLGKFHAEFFKLAAIYAPKCIRCLWIGGTAQQYAARNLMFDAIPTGAGPQEILTDPYNNAKNLTARAIDTWRPKVDDWRNTGAQHNAHWLRWGSPRIGLGETGISSGRTAADGTVTPVYSDAEMVPWIESMYEAAVTLRLTIVNYFNSKGPNGNQQIINASFPQAVAALSGEITQAKQALAAVL